MIGFGTYESFEAEGGRYLTCYRPPVPPLPPIDDVWEVLDRARAVVAEFDRALSTFPVPGVVGRLFARLDAVHSSGAEGATTTFTDLLEFQTVLRRAKDPHDAASVSGAAEAFDALHEGMGDPLDAALAIHRRLFERDPDPYWANQAGRWKTYANATDDPESATGLFHYTSPASLSGVLEEWRAFTMAEGGPELVRQALSHWMFEHVHPTADGNGRVGRLLVPLILRAKGATANACAFLGEAVHRDKGVYVSALKRGRQTGDMGAWTRVFLSLTAQTAGLNLDRVARLGALYDGWRRATKGVRADSAVHDLVPWIVTRPTFTVRDALAGIGRGTFASVNRAVGQLANAGIVEPVGAGQRDRLFTASAIVALFEGPAAQRAPTPEPRSRTPRP
ncbi:Fic family protein [Azospirillum sp. CT11-132]|uniref:Fic family protein n=1 Tax=unclassified Azospirillum TaxID=2630922 RepID=UPI000D60A160|nr:MULTISPECIES: Fic family protein [unclassified Azospirillum]PWC54210.1 hypothetical protein TSH7_31565 [Azospirillum sp. TSH7]PWC69955.1 hypothetical protein TSH20_08125 [Azospirillum sp. TSH20]